MANTNGMATASLILGIIGLCVFPICSPIALILGGISLSQINKTGQEGKGMAITGLVLGIIGTLFWVFGMLFYILIIGASLAA